jgi:mono/diheme cytochrome c family protein
MRKLRALRKAALTTAAACVFAVAGGGSAQQPKIGQKSFWNNIRPRSNHKPQGYVQYHEYCTACHGAGVGKPGTLALQAKYKGSKPALLADRTDLTPQLVKTYVRNGVSAMPFFRKTEISDADLDMIAAYLSRHNRHDPSR